MVLNILGGLGLFAPSTAKLKATPSFESWIKALKKSHQDFCRIPTYVSIKQLDVRFFEYLFQTWDYCVPLDLLCCIQFQG